jgi:hypothetical protein
VIFGVLVVCVRDRKDAMCIDIPGELRDEDVAVRLVGAYFADDPATGRARYWGAYFERLGGGGDRPETAYQFTAEDLLAVSMLSVSIDRYYALHVLDYQARELSGLLVQIPLGIALQDPGAGALIAEGGPAWELWRALHDIRPRPGDNQLGPVAAGKLLARKRPRLVPIHDSRVRQVLGRPGNDLWWWRDLRCKLIEDEALVGELESVRARAGAGHLSLLRTFDIMCWMFGGSQGQGPAGT